MSQDISTFQEGRRYQFQMFYRGLIFIISSITLEQAFIEQTSVDSRLLVASLIAFFPSFILYMKAAHNYLPFDKEYPLTYTHKDRHSQNK